mgnify:CR=1 FL=1
MSKYLSLFVLAFLSYLSLGVVAGEFDGKKVLYIDSYHEGYAWSDGMTESIVGIIGESGAELKIHRMDTKRNKTVEFKQKAALDAKKLIESFQPDVVIATDDNASKYLLAPYYKGSSIPFVFAGVNWDATPYGFPTSNITGMVEVNAYPDLLDLLNSMARGEKVGFLSGPGETGALVVERSKKILGLEISEVRQANTFEEWKSSFIDLNGKVDVLLLNNNAGITDWDKEAAKQFVERNTKIPTGSTNAWMLDYSLMTYAKLASEQGEWAALTAMRILLGESPADIPIERNKRGDIGINKRVASAIGVTVSENIEFSASIVIE